MTQSHTYDGGAITTVRLPSVSLTQSAELGAVGSSSLTIADDAGTIEIVGQKDWAVTESAATPTTLWSGFVASRRYERTNAPPVEASRNIEVTLVDLNAMLGFRGIRGVTSDVSRPAETVAQRGAWLLGQAAVSGLFVDNGRCEFSTSKKMTKTNYRNRYPGDVLADMALAQGGVNFHVQDYGAGPELIFRDDNASTADSSTLRISNVLADQDGSTLAPFKDAVLTRDPGRVKSQLALEWAQGNVYAERTATATAFNGIRFGVATNSDIKTSQVATREAKDMLWQLHTEEDVIECSVEVTDAQVDLIMAGYRIQARFSHLLTEGYGDFTWFRVLERTVKPLVTDPQLYELQLKLSPQEAANSSSCPFELTESQSIPLPTKVRPPGAVYDFAVSDGIVYYCRPGQLFPVFPTPGYEGAWHFETFGYLGTADTFASGFQNELRFILIGSGTLTIETVQWESEPQPWTLQWEAVDPLTGATTQQSIQSGIAGDPAEVEIDIDASGSCISVIRLRADARSDAYIGMGWSGATWVAA